MTENEIGATVLLALMIGPFFLPHLLPGAAWAANILITAGLCQLVAGVGLTVALASEGRMWIFALLLAAFGIWTLWASVRFRRRLSKLQASAAEAGAHHQLSRRRPD